MYGSSPEDPACRPGYKGSRIQGSKWIIFLSKNMVLDDLPAVERLLKALLQSRKRNAKSLESLAPWPLESFSRLLVAET
jgi:hypothetical protein